MGLISKSRRAGSPPTFRMHPDLGSGREVANRSSADRAQRDTIRAVLMSMGFSVVGAVTLFAVGLALEGVALSVYAVLALATAVWLRRVYRRLNR
jgi:hypothetical protein